MTRRTTIVSVVAALTAIFVALGASPSVHAQGIFNSPVGAWTVTANVNVPPGSPPFVLTELVSFNFGGTITDTNSIAHSCQNPFVPAPLIAEFSDLYGAWRQTPGSNQFGVTFKRLIYACPNDPFYGSLFPGQLVGEATIGVSGTVQDTGNTLAGTFTFQLTKLDGTVVFRGSGFFTATRINISN
jgi:hypothetical protein